MSTEQQASLVRIARAFDAASRLLTGMSPEERMSVVGNMMAIEIYLFKKANPRESIIEVYEHVFTAVIEAVNQNQNDPQSMPTIHDILNEANKQKG
jgi:hypothetical protein